MSTTTAPPVHTATRRSTPATGATAGPDLATDVLATLALGLYSVAVAAGFARVFSGWEFLDDLVVIVAVVHGLSLVLRRLGVAGWLAVPAVAVVCGWSIAAMQYWPTFSWGLPTADTWMLATDEIELVRSQFRTAVAPVAYVGGWDLLAMIGVAAATLVSDTFAFRAYARAEALVPGGVLFVFVAALGDDRLRVPLTVALVATGVLATAALRRHHAAPPPVADQSAAAVGRRPIDSAGWLAAVGVAVVVAVAAGLAGPRVPGAAAEPIYDTRGGGGGVTEVLSPLVDIRSRLTNQRNVELFVVQSNEPSYWRSSALASFDGRVWGLPERPLESTDGPLGGATSGADIRHNVRIVNLGGSLVPAAPTPVAASGGDDLRWNSDAATLVNTGADLSPGLQFDIVSNAPRFDSATLATAGSSLAQAGDPIYLELPDDLPSVVEETARAVTAGATTPYQQALALQDWFRSEFQYSLEVQAGHGLNAIEAFLRDRTGYCEQFAGTYAAMMRTIGVPARVAVGFTPGRTIAEGTYSVIGKNAHAWPEVWFDGLGWVPFEPTPGRGVPGAEGYTGVAEAQDGSAPEPGEPGDDGATPSPTTLPPDIDGPTAPQQPDLPDEFDPTGSDGSAADTERSDTSWRWQLAAIGVAAAALAAPAVVRRVRRRRHDSPDAQLRSLWSRACSAATAVGVPADDSLTPVEFASATAARFPVAARPMRSLADLVTIATFSPSGSAGFDAPGSYGSTTMRSAAHWCQQIERAASDSLTTTARIQRYFTVWE
jgi:transglutaminase-like putative cysteine protease